MPSLPLTRRRFLKLASAAAAGSAACTVLRQPEQGVLVNDVHSQLNPTLVDRIVPVRTVDQVRELVKRASTRQPISIAGSRHAMGGQQFATGSTLIDTRGLNRILSFDQSRGLVEVEAGIEWPELITGILERQGDVARWGIAQKQTGADRLTIAGALAANVHGRGLKMRPFIGDVESLRMIDSSGEEIVCDRQRNAELFGLAIGGYGLFGVITAVTLRLTPRRKLERVVTIEDVETVIPAFEQRIADGYLYGDCQFSIDDKSGEFLTEGVFSCYKPVEDDRPVPEEQKGLYEENWRQLLVLAHTDRAEVYRMYADYYLSTTGQLYWSDTHQLTTYLTDYHKGLDQLLGARVPATEIITEIYIPRARLADFMREAATQIRSLGVPVIYGTIRLIERDDECYLAWAREPFACVIFNLHTEHSREGQARSAMAFRALIDLANARGGSYYLTYHRYATRQQVERSHPRFASFLRLKRQYDPEERLQSDWYRHYRSMFGA